MHRNKFSFEFLLSVVITTCLILSRATGIFYFMYFIIYYWSYHAIYVNLINISQTS